jgi:rRNA-processing protein EBP2
MLTTEEDFDVQLDSVDSGRGDKRSKMTREKRNERYGFGGPKRNNKRNDDDVGETSAFGNRGRGRGGRGGLRGGKRKGGPQRLGKNRRMHQKSRS